ncbi:hypothetical protein HRI_002325900 [Hibiscus trionum]|uniref:Uncharacterized protein n=1 Tax=Hibiscus trionum TaxID=183268 RepID=A0A9W7I080_HIBTR|nr:hypothetical protein HRI_002325900 [Hibiscus trionum]
MTAAERPSDYTDNSLKRKAPIGNDSAVYRGNGNGSNGSHGSGRDTGNGYWNGKDIGNGKGSHKRVERSKKSSFWRNQTLCCFLCKGPHRVASCLHKVALNVLKTITQDGYGSDH